jgi:hypothetical protein
VATPVFLLVATFHAQLISAGPEESALAGRWKLERDRSTDIDPWREMTYDIRLQGSEITLVKTLRAGRYHQRDSMTVIPDDQEREAPMTHGKWMEQVHMGARVGALSMRVVRARWEGEGKVLYLQSRVTVETSQGDAPVIIERRFHISEDGSSMALTEARSTRTSGTPLVYDFSRPNN